MRLFAIEGNTQRLDGGAMFGNAPKALWEKWYPADAENRIHLATRALLLQLNDGRNILFEAGVGTFFEPKLKQRYGVVEEEHRLLQSLQQIGLQDSDIDSVILSHLHFDHAGGILSAYGDGEPRLLFPKARFYVGKQQFERALTPHMRERASFIPLINEKLTTSGRLVLVDHERHPDLDFGVTFRFVHGHTLGLMLAQLVVEDRPLVFVSDLIPGAAWMHLPITMGYDRFAELLIDEKAALLQELLKSNGQVFFTHDPQVSFADVKQDEKGRYVATSSGDIRPHKHTESC